MTPSTIGTLAGLAITIASPAYMAWWRWHVARHWTLVEGVVVDVLVTRDEANTGVECGRPVIRFRRPDGETVQFRSQFNGTLGVWSEGDTVMVRMRGDVVEQDAPRFALEFYVIVMMVGLAVIATAQGWMTVGESR